MKRFPLLSLFAIAAAAACSSSGALPGATGNPFDGGTDPAIGADGGLVSPGDAGPYFPLAMNDVTILAPLPASLAAPVLMRAADTVDDGTALVPRALFDRLVGTNPSQPVVPPDAYDHFQLVAVRFDLCDHNMPGECALGADGRLRLVLQPLFDTSGAPEAEDVGIHLFFSIPQAENATAVAMLRDLARLQAEPSTSPLKVSPALSGPNAAAYATKLRAFVKRFAGESKLVRMTLNAQPIFVSAIHWSLRGLEKKGGAFEEMHVLGANEVSQEITLVSNASYDVTPASDVPTGLSTVLTKTAFDAAPAGAKASLLAVLAAVDNPLTNAPDTVSCIACHASTVVMRTRADGIGVDPNKIAGRYTSTYDLSVAAGKSERTERTLRALGYLGKDVMISQRVANDTAQVLSEIDKRYPR